MEWIDGFLNSISVLLAQVTYPTMSACAAFWVIVSFVEWRRGRRTDRLTHGLFMLAVLLQFNWLAVIAGAPWSLPAHEQSEGGGRAEDMSIYRPYIRVGWSMVAICWVIHSVVMIRMQRVGGGAKAERRI